MEHTLTSEIDRLIEQLKSPSTDEGVSAIAGLTRFDWQDERVIPALIKVARDDPVKIVRGEAQSSSTNNPANLLLCIT